MPTECRHHGGKIIRASSKQNVVSHIVSEYNLWLHALIFNCMNASNELYQHLIQQFIHYSIPELIELNNELVNGNGWGSNRATFRTAVLATLAKKGINLSSIISKEDGFTSIRIAPLKLTEGNVVVPV